MTFALHYPPLPLNLPTEFLTLTVLVLVLWTGDTLGSNCVRGFKEGVGGALRICRHCRGTKEETKQRLEGFTSIIVIVPGLEVLLKYF